MVPMMNPNKQIFNIEKSEVSRLLKLGWTLVNEKESEGNH